MFDTLCCLDGAPAAENSILTAQFYCWYPAPFFTLKNLLLYKDHSLLVLFISLSVYGLNDTTVPHLHSVFFMRNVRHFDWLGILILEFHKAQQRVNLSII